MCCRRKRHEMFCPTYMNCLNGTTLKHCHANQTGAQVDVAAEYGPQYRMPLSNLVDKGRHLSVIRRKQQTVVDLGDRRLRAVETTV